MIKKTLLVIFIVWSVLLAAKGLIGIISLTSNSSNSNNSNANVNTDQIQLSNCTIINKEPTLYRCQDKDIVCYVTHNMTGSSTSISCVKSIKDQPNS